MRTTPAWLGTARRTLVAAIVCAGLAASAEARSIKVGDPAPPVELVTFDKQKIELADLKGQVVVLNFWATWCGPCKAELPLLDAAAAQKKDKGLRIFAVTIDDTAPPSVLKKVQAVLSFPLLRRVKGKYDTIGGAVPTNYVIDRAGVVRYAHAGAFTIETINSVLLPLLREPAPPAEPPAATPVSSPAAAPPAAMPAAMPVAAPGR